MTGTDVVTGAFSYSGRAIARHLLQAGRQVRTLTGHPERAAEAALGQVETRPLDFADTAGLKASLEGATTLYNTYWVRFAHGGIDHQRAVDNSLALFRAAAEAGVAKVVHISILHPSLTSPYPYFRGKAQVERGLAETGLPHAVLRPSVLFDEHCVLINNIAWLLRHLPVFAIGGDGAYRVRPVHVDDLAALALDAAGWAGNTVVDAVGPERPTFAELVSQVRAAVGGRALVVKLPPPVVLAASRAIGAVMHDVLLTPDEYHAMADGLADSQAPPTGSVALSPWLLEQAENLGRHYINELKVHFSVAR